MPNVVLIVTDDSDAHADSVVLELTRRGIELLRLHTGDYPRAVTMSLSVRGASVGGRISTERRSVDLADISAAWYRRPAEPRPAADTDPAAKEFVTTQARRFLWALYSALNVNWVCDPFKVRVAEIKPLQLRIAAEVGLRTPLTLVSNAPDDVAAFAAQLAGACAVKPLEAIGVFAQDGYRLPLTTVLPSGYAPDGVSYAPTIFQEYVPKKAELRIVVIGRELFCAQVDSSDAGTARHDWRAGPAAFRPGPDLPDSVAASIARLLDRFSLNFASIDMAITPDGEYVFFELNPNGQWLWLELELGFPLTARLADLLTTLPSRAPSRDS